jgi:hypothetical protein
MPSRRKRRTARKTCIRVNPLEQQLLQSETTGAEPRLCIRSGTLVDTGRWWRRSPVWLCATESELIMLAVARRQFFARIALSEARASRYHHATGELVIEPDETLPLHRFKLPPDDALRILNLIHSASQAPHNQPQPTSC